MSQFQPNPALAPLLYRALLKIMSQGELCAQQKIEATYQLLTRIYQEATRREKLPFTTHFARLAYAAHKFGLPKTLQYYVHQFRRRVRREMDQTEQEETLLLAYKVTAEVILGIWRIPPPEELAQELPLQWPMPWQEETIVDFKASIRVLALEDDAEQQQLIARAEDRPGDPIRIAYNIADRNEQFMHTIQVVRKVTGFPVLMNILDVEITAEGIYRPQAFIIEPDYLVDVSAVADAFQGKDTHPWGQLVKKFLPFETSPALLLGNIANYFLDKLMTKPEVSFKELVPELFGLDPLAFCTFSDQVVRELMGKAQGHFVRLKQMVNAGFAAEDIQPKDCYLEPAFYSEKYGLQGRLDLLYQPTQADARTAIVELKSGKPFMANIHGISPNHFIQTVLYDLLVHSAFGAKRNVGCYILYSSQEDRPLRFAPTIKAQQYEALQTRNQLLAIEYLLTQLGTEEQNVKQVSDRIFLRLQPKHFPNLKGFTRKNLAIFQQVYQGLTGPERAYFGAFSGFIAREQLLAKTGVQGDEQLNGLASLWLDHPAEKEQNYQRLAKLQLVVDQSGQNPPLLILLRGEATNTLANFRTGDIVVLFPYTEDGHGMVQNQIFKCTIVAIDAEQVTVRLRSQQFNARIFREQAAWSLEHDLLDSSFYTYYRGLFAWASTKMDTRRLLLGQRPPKQTETKNYNWPSILTREQQQILNAILSSEEYYLLWGPPGTGKTSMMLHHLVKYLMEDSSEHLLLLAYTNRAVDEICEAIERISPLVATSYLRIGSNYGTHPDYQDKLLQEAISSVKTRKELKAVIQQKRIFVGTVASVSGKSILFQLKQFDRIIIDEASQLLEPLLVGLLPQAPKWVLIGDHRQLPAVVTQPSSTRVVKDEQLHKLGIHDLGQSLFERLFLQAQRQEWTWAYAQLTHQGRMHQDIMRFPAEHFYQGYLHCLPVDTTAYERQIAPLQLNLPPDANYLEQQLAKQRLLFLPTTIDEGSTTLKTNRHEAQMVVDIIKAFKRLWPQPLSESDLGIITPYRAQIAQIRSLLEQESLENHNFTIDTVERYQGGARNIIIISLCTNAERQLQSLSSLSTEGVDRKLNVAMTRARQHLVLLGNPDLLQRSPIYAELLDFCRGE